MPRTCAGSIGLSARDMAWARKWPIIARILRLLANVELSAIGDFSA